MLPSISQETLPEMIGTRRSCVNYFMNKFPEMASSCNKREIQINASLPSVVLRD
jgi:CRP/FNR family cyclic AMP-dependent transcriptional regulator